MPLYSRMRCFVATTSYGVFKTHWVQTLSFLQCTNARGRLTEQMPVLSWGSKHRSPVSMISAALFVPHPEILGCQVQTTPLRAIQEGNFGGCLHSWIEIGTEKFVLGKCSDD